MRALILALAAFIISPAMAAEPGVDVAEVASTTFVKACLGHREAYDLLRDKLQPGRDLYLPRVPDAQAGPFLRGLGGEAYSRSDAGVVLALTKDEQCAVFVQKVSPDALYKRLEKDIRTVAAKAYSVQPAGREAKGPLLARFIDLAAVGEYRAELVKIYGPDLPILRVILTTTEAANSGLQAHISIGTRQP